MQMWFMSGDPTCVCFPLPDGIGRKASRTLRLIYRFMLYRSLFYICLFWIIRKEKGGDSVNKIG